MKIHGTKREYVEVEIDESELIDKVIGLLELNTDMTERFIHDGYVVEDEDYGHGSTSRKSIRIASEQDHTANSTRRHLHWLIGHIRKTKIKRAAEDAARLLVKQEG